MWAFRRREFGRHDVFVTRWHKILLGTLRELVTHHFLNIHRRRDWELNMEDERTLEKGHFSEELELLRLTFRGWRKKNNETRTYALAQAREYIGEMCIFFSGNP